MVALFAANLRYQFYDRTARRQRSALLGLRSQYRMFSPIPGRTDLHLVVRDYDRDGAPRPCREVPTTPLRRWTHALWNPWKRRWLPLRPLVVELIGIGAALEGHPAAIELTTPYLVLLGVVSAEPADGDVRARQFLVVHSFGHEPEEPPAVLFCSAVHRLDRTTAETG
ncbi:MAG: hypothetical protein KF703_07810 [Actinobacteria bacterium]|nr:hypothetical protein [Actinomycetota bacterium]